VAAAAGAHGASIGIDNFAEIARVRRAFAAGNGGSRTARDPATNTTPLERHRKRMTAIQTVIVRVVGIVFTVLAWVVLAAIIAGVQRS
jgi:hypothetical protein